MMTTSDPISADHAESYYKREHTEDYYVGSETIGTWFGKGAAKLGLTGDVRREHFRRVLDGRHPALELELVRGSTAKDGKRTAAWDVTFAAPKSVSIVAVIGRDERVIAAHDAAVRDALSAVEACARGRLREHRRGALTGNLVVAQFRHETSRQLDPHLHTHNVVVNMTKRSERTWSALDSSFLFELQHYGTAVYRARLAEELERAGYSTRSTGRGTFEIEGVSDAAITHYSQRQSAIIARLRSQGAPEDAAEYKKARRATRPRKRHVSREQLSRLWGAPEVASPAAAPSAEESSDSESGRRKRRRRRRTPALEASVEPDETSVAIHGETTAVIRTARESIVPATVAEPNRAKVRETVRFAVEHVSERLAVFDRPRLVTEALAAEPGAVRRRDVEREIDRLLSRGALVDHTTLPAMTTRENLELERDIVARVTRGRGAVEPILQNAEFPDHGLSEEQLAAAKAILASPDRTVGVQGYAGTGKTTLLRAVLDRATAAGFIVRGIAPTTGATEELIHAGLDSRTLASHLAHPGAARDRELWIVDEASLIATRAMADLLRQADAAGARVVLVGDIRQHSAVEAGAPFRVLQSEGMQTLSLSDIRRQRNKGLRDAVVLAATGSPRSAARMLEASGVVEEIADWHHRHEAIADAYAAEPSGTLIVAPSNAERRELNELIRERLRAQARIAGGDVAVETLHGRDLTRAERRLAARYREGDVLRFRRGARAHRIAGGSYATVVARDEARNVLTVMLPNGRHATYDPRRLSGVDIYSTEEKAFAAGDRIVIRTPMKREKIPNGAIGTITAIDSEGGARIAFDGRSAEVTLDLRSARHLDYGYAVTSHSSQGKTVDRALVAIRTRHPGLLVNSSQFYVSISRARDSVRIFTDDRGRLAPAVSRPAPAPAALDLEHRQDL